MSGLQADYAEAWQLPARWPTIEKMRSDPAVTATLAALTFPILAAPLEVEAASDDPDDLRYAEFVEQNLNGMTTTLARHRMEALGCVGDGVRIFETVYEKREDGLYHLRKLALRPNKTIIEWRVDDTGGPAGVTQLLGDGRTEKLEMDRLLAFTHMGEGPSLLGRPATRPMYRPWWLIDRVSRAGAVAIDRHGAGIPWARYEGTNVDERRKVEQALMGLHTNERSFLLWNRDVPEWGIQGVDGATMDPVPFMEYQRRDLFLAPLAQFLALGTDSVGSMALSQDHSSFFLMALRFVAEEIEGAYNSFLIPRLIGYNWTVTEDHLPRVKHGNLDQRNAFDWASGIAKAVEAGVSFPPDELAKVAGDMFGVTIPEAAPEPDETDGIIEPALLNGIQVEKALDIMSRFRTGDLNYLQAETALRGFLAVKLELIPLLLGGKPEDVKRAPVATATPGVADVNDPNAPETVDNAAQWPGVDLADAGLQSPVMLSALGIAVDFAGMSGRLDDAEARIVKALAPLQAKARTLLLNAAREIIAKGDAEELARFELKSDKERDAIAAILAAVYDFGAEQIGAEMESQGAKAKKPDGKAKAAAMVLLGVAAAEMARSLSDRMRTAWGSAVVGQMRTGYDKDALAAAVTVPGERLLADVARRGPTVALGMGREDAVAASGGNVELLYSAAMDGATCGPCRQFDGTRYPVKEGGYKSLVPNPACKGGARCRCILVPVAE